MLLKIETSYNRYFGNRYHNICINVVWEKTNLFETGPRKPTIEFELCRRNDGDYPKLFKGIYFNNYSTLLMIIGSIMFLDIVDDLKQKIFDLLHFTDKLSLALTRNGPKEDWTNTLNNMNPILLFFKRNCKIKFIVKK